MRTRTSIGFTCLGSLALVLSPPNATDAASGVTVRWIAAHSSNFSRRSSRRIDRVVIHTIEGSEDAGISWFRNSRANVSSHYVVSHAGRVTQMVRDKDMAWHAGTSNMNARSIGIENEGYASRNGWTNTHYRQLAALTRSLCDRYRIPMDRAHIIGHSEVTRRKVDPGRHFDWTRFIQLVRGSSAPVTPPVKGDTGPVAAGNRYVIETTANSLRVRAGVWGTVLGSVSRGSRFVVRGGRAGWLQVDFRGGSGWVHGGYTRRVSRVEAVEVTARRGLNARSGPSTRYRILTVLSPGGTYAVTAHSAGWVRLQIDQRQAWVSARYVKQVAVK